MVAVLVLVLMVAVVVVGEDVVVIGGVLALMDVVVVVDNDAKVIGEELVTVVVEGCTDTALTKNRGKLDPKRGRGARWASNLGSILPPVCVCASGGPDGAAGSAWAGSGAARLVELGRLHH